jgi:hypothetical protein
VEKIDRVAKSNDIAVTYEDERRFHSFRSLCPQLGGSAPQSRQFPEDGIGRDPWIRRSNPSLQSTAHHRHSMAARGSHRPPIPSRNYS